MAPSHIDAAETCDVFVVGAGLAGLTAAIGFARAGRRVVSPARPSGSARVGPSRCSAASVDFLDELGVWPAVAPRAAPMRALADRRRHRLAVRAAADRIPRRARSAATLFGWNVENAALADALEAAAAAAIRISFASRPTSPRSISRPSAPTLDARRRTRLRRRAGRRRGRARFAVAPRRRDFGPRAPLSAERADGRARPRAPARRRLDRVPHPPGAVHAGAPARGAGRAASLEPGLGDERGGGEAARRARRRARWPRRSSARRARCSARCGSRASAECSRWRARASAASSRPGWRWSATRRTPSRRSARRGSTWACATSRR